MINDLITHLREDIGKVDDPQAKALFEVSAEVLGGLQKAFEHYESLSEKALDRLIGGRFRLSLGAGRDVGEHHLCSPAQAASG